MIHAHSPAAKGRIERLFQTLQDRLVKELRFAGASTLAEANQVLQRYLPLHNQRFRVEAAQPTDLHRRVPARLDLNTVLCLKTQRRLNADSSAPESVFDRRGGSPLQVYALRPVTDCNCVAARRGGEQQEVNDPSVE